ncbi:N-terminal acetyltransferase [Tulasnella sp. 330]|nr:N-terminal acetyltransferase [Tulasnella sp. 330]
MTEEDVDRVKSSDPSHMTLLVQAGSNSETYMVDPGFSFGPAPLKDLEIVLGAAPPEKHRLMRAAPPNSSIDIEADEEGKRIAEEWRFQVNVDEHRKPLPQGSWRTLYAFNQSEFFLRDFEVFSFFVAHRPGTIFGDRVNAVRWEAYGGGNEHYLARLVLTKDGKVMWYGGEDVKILKECRSETDRVLALRGYFGIRMDEGAEKHLRSELRLVPLESS